MNANGKVKGGSHFPNNTIHLSGLQAMLEQDTILTFESMDYIL